MAKGARGWTLYRDARKGVYFVRFRHGGVRHKRSTRTSDRAEALAESARIYDEVVHGERAIATKGPVPPLAKLLAQWLSDFAASHAPRTTQTYEEYAARFVSVFRSLALITKASIAAHARARLRVVRATTVRKEMSALRSFLAWCVDDARVLTEAPQVMSIPKRAVGTPGKWSDGADRSQRRIDLSPAQVEAIIAHLPETSRRGHASRDIVALIWETSLRHATISRLRTPEHYAPGAGSLRITADIDKARYARDLPLSPRAAEILARNCPDEPGLIFGRVALAAVLGTAAREAGLPPSDARKVGPHDLRHAAMTHAASSPGAPLAGIAYLAGHLHVSTTARYVHAPREAAEIALAARSGAPIGTPRKPPKGARKGAAKKSAKKKG